MVKSQEDKLVGLQTLPCKYLNKSTKKCSVYESRFEKVKECLSVEEAILGKALPAECLYVKEIENYKGKEFVSLDKEKELLKSVIKKADPDNLPDFMSDDFKNLVRSYHERS